MTEKSVANDNVEVMYEIWCDASVSGYPEDWLIAIFPDKDDAEDYLQYLNSPYYYIEEAEYE